MRAQGEEINKLLFKMIQMSSLPQMKKIAFRLAEEITVTRTFFDFLRRTLHIKEKKRKTQHYSKKLYFW